jgi:hypothetical protein
MEKETSMNSALTDIAHTREDGSAYWLSREVCSHFGYDMTGFVRLLFDRVRRAWDDMDEHMLPVWKENGKLQDYELDELALKLVIMAMSPENREIVAREQRRIAESALLAR